MQAAKVKTSKPNPVTHNRAGFTLIELLVVIAVIAILLSILLPAVQAIREAARQNSCKNNLKQLGLALQTFQTTQGYYPSSWRGARPNDSTDTVGWSAQTQLLPYLEQVATFEKIDFTQPYSATIPVETADGVTVNLGSLRIQALLCPSELRDMPRGDSHYPLNYGVNLGTWFVYDPTTDKGGPGAFYPRSRLKPDDFRDGLTNTLAMAEIKGWTPYYRNSANATETPLLPAEICSSGAAGEFQTESGHTEWIDGRAHQTGFTTTFPPNTEVTCIVEGESFDVDFTNWQEGKASITNATYAAVTARSYHSGLVNVVLMDGSVRPISEMIDVKVWRAASTRSGDEILPGSFHE